MKANPNFRSLPKSFWAHVRSISQQVGYTVRGQGQIRVPSLLESRNALHGLNLDPSRVADEQGRPTELGTLLHSYFSYRADVLNNTVKKHLMKAEERGRYSIKHVRRRTMIARSR